MTSTIKTRFLNKLDRCDKCNAQASVAIQFKTGELMFCGHHLIEYTPQMKKVETAIVGWQEPPDEFK